MTPPREPTVAMLQVDVEHAVCGKFLSGCALGEVWRAMYDAYIRESETKPQHTKAA